ncbi:MAG: hypothetical protein ACLFRP_06360 [Puniceicoccaceae bacterium]
MTESPTDEDLEKKLGRKPTAYDRLTRRDKALLLLAFVLLPLILIGLVIGIGF